uniref:ZF(RING)-14 zinc finger protein n=1 Tax=Phallusia mammillata TaxID=59560 RepID=A0A6F9D8E2_9ASCI|nr:ZF(RING)-14 zinc finger protein [Phallusia mammillata]
MDQLESLESHILELFVKLEFPENYRKKIFYLAFLLSNLVRGKKRRAVFQKEPAFQQAIKNYTDGFISWCQPPEPTFWKIYINQRRAVLFRSQPIRKKRVYLCDHFRELYQTKQTVNNGIRTFDESHETEIKFRKFSQQGFVLDPFCLLGKEHTFCKTTLSKASQENKSKAFTNHATVDLAKTDLKSDFHQINTTHLHKSDSSQTSVIKDEVVHTIGRTAASSATAKKNFAARYVEHTAELNALQHFLARIGSVYIYFVLFIISIPRLVFFAAQSCRPQDQQGSLQQLHYDEAQPRALQHFFVEFLENYKIDAPIPGTAAKFVSVVSDPNTGNAESSSRRAEDLKREIYRLTTFQAFPQSVRINPSELARAGFFFTGQDDAVQCFACNNTLSNLGPHIDPFNLRSHRSTCGFTRNTDSCGNVPFNVGLSSRGHNSMPAQRPAAGEILTRHSYPSQPSSYNQPHSTPAVPPAPPANLVGSVPGLPAYQTARPVPPSAFSTARPVAAVPEYDYPLLRQMANIVDPNHERLVLGLDLGKESERLRSFTTAWNQDALPPPWLMAKAGWFFLGNLDRTQCFSCGQVLRNWRRSDDPLSEHLRHFPHCRMAQGSEPRNIPDRVQQSLEPVRRVRLTEQEKIDLRAMFPCDRPVSPHMRTQQSRVASFRNWPYTRATPDMISAAGFFSLGVRDRVKCYYCNGGLQNWRRNDDPWEEHAKWYPTCEYLLQNRGPEYIHSVVSRFPDLDRPVPRASGQDVPPSTSRSTVQSGPEQLPTPQPKTVDPAVQMQQEESLLEEAMRSDVATTVIGMGFDESVVRRLMRENIAEHGAAYQSASALLDAVLNIPSSSQEEEEEQPHAPAQETTPTLAQPSSGSRRESPIDEDEDIYASEEMVQDRPQNSFSPTSGVMESMEPAENPYQDPSRYSSALFGNSFSATNSALLPPLAPRGGGLLHERVHSGPVRQSHPSIPTSSRANSLPVPSAQARLPQNEDHLKQRLQQLQDEKLCKVCLDRTADVVFIPCGHICCCLECTRALRACPICRVRIEKAVKTYTS